MLSTVKMALTRGRGRPGSRGRCFQCRLRFVHESPCLEAAALRGSGVDVLVVPEVIEDAGPSAWFELHGLRILNPGCPFRRRLNDRERPVVTDIQWPPARTARQGSKCLATFGVVERAVRSEQVRVGVPIAVGSIERK